MNLRKEQAILLFFLLGATLGTGFDALYVYNKVERYPMPFFLGIAWWVPLLFGAATAAIGYSHPMVDRLLHHRRVRSTLLLCIGELTWLLLADLLSVSFLDSVAKVGLLLVVYLYFWVLAGRSWQNLLLSLVTAITGTLIEMILVAAGAFSYLHPDFIGVPYWLPCIYAIASLTVGDVGRFFLNSSSRGNA